MDERFDTGSVIGKKSDTHWAQIIKTPHVFGVVEIEEDEGNAQRVGMDLVHKITNQVSEEAPSITRLFSLCDELWNTHIQTLILCVPIGKTITILLRGSGVVYLKRNGNIARLRSREGTISGVVYPKDIVFLSSKTCLDGISEEEFFSFFDHLSVEEVAEKLTLHLHTKNEAVGYAGLFVEVKEIFSGFEEHHTAVPNPIPGQEKEQSFGSASGLRKLKTTYARIPHRLKQKFMPLMKKFRTMDIRITGVLIVIFFLSIGFGIIKEKTRPQTTEISNNIHEGQRLYDEGIALLDLNAVKSRERLMEAKQVVEMSKKSISPKTKEGRMVAELEKKIADALPKAAKEFDVTPELFFDVSLLKEGSTIETFGMYEDMMALLDTRQKTVFTLQLSTKNGQVVGGGSALDGSQKVSIHGENVYVFTPQGIHVFNTQSKSVKPYVIKRAEEWIAIQAFTSFAGNLYLLDTGKNRIWKYVATGSAYSPIREYLLPDFFPDISKSTDMVIDGSVWLSTTDGSVTRFTQGKDDPFIPKGVEPPLGTTLSVFTNDSCVYVYVLDPDNKRVVVLEKDGMYVSQYRYPATFSSKAIAVSEKLGKLFFFSEGKLYTVVLK